MSQIAAEGVDDFYSDFKHLFNSQSQHEYVKHEEEKYDLFPEETQKKSIDSAIAFLKASLASYGHPEPGDLKSRDKKEIKKTLKCFRSLLA